MKIQIPYSSLPDAESWQDGERYTVTLTGKQVSSDDEGVTLEVEEAQGDMADQGPEPMPEEERMPRSKTMESNDTY